MHRIDTPTRAIDKNGDGKDGFQNGDPAQGVVATQVDDDWCNALQEELATVIEDAGIALAKGQQNQLLGAINSKIQEAVGSSVDGIATARTRGTSGRPDFLRPAASRRALVLAATSTPLTLGAGGLSNIIQAQEEISGLPASPSSRVGITFASPLTNETDGEVGYIYQAGVKHGEIPLAGSPGAPVLARVGLLAAFKISVNRETEYFIAKIGAGKLTNVYRRYFVDANGNRLSVRSGSVSSATMVELIHVMRDLTNGNFLALPSTRITESDAAPSSPIADDLWLNTATGQWSRFISGSFVAIALVRCGYLVVEGTECVAAKSFDLQQSYSNANNLEMEVASNSSLALANPGASASVYGRTREFLSGATWGTLLDGSSLTATKKMTAYIMDTGARFISDVSAQYSPHLKGWYHPTEAARAVGEFYTNSRAQFAAERNDFPWQRFALHGELPTESKVYDRGAADPVDATSSSPSNNLEQIDNEFIIGVGSQQGSTGRYYFQCKEGYIGNDFEPSVWPYGQTTPFTWTWDGTNLSRFRIFLYAPNGSTPQRPRFRARWRLVGIKGERFKLWNRLK